MGASGAGATRENSVRRIAVPGMDAMRTFPKTHLLTGAAAIRPPRLGSAAHFRRNSKTLAFIPLDFVMAARPMNDMVPLRRHQPLRPGGALPNPMGYARTERALTLRSDFFVPASNICANFIL